MAETVNYGGYSLTFSDATHVKVTAFSPSGYAGVVTIPPSVSEIGDNVFNRQYYISGFDIQGDITYVGFQAFASCVGLTQITFSENLTGIGNAAFKGTYLTSIFIPTPSITMVQIGTGAFLGCPNLVSVVIEGGFAVVNPRVFSGCRKLKSVSISGDWLSIPDGMFQYCSALTSVSLPDSVTQIGDNAFDDCQNMAQINFPAALTSIGLNAFRNSGLTSIVIPSSVEQIKSGAFSYNASFRQGAPSDLTNITFLGNGSNLTVASSAFNFVGTGFVRVPPIWDPTITSIGGPNAGDSVLSVHFNVVANDPANAGSLLVSPPPGVTQMQVLADSIIAAVANPSSSNTIYASLINSSLASADGAAITLDESTAAAMYALLAGLNGAAAPLPDDSTITVGIPSTENIFPSLPYASPLYLTINSAPSVDTTYTFADRSDTITCSLTGNQMWNIGVEGSMDQLLVVGNAFMTSNGPQIVNGLNSISTLPWAPTAVSSVLQTNGTEIVLTWTIPAGVEASSFSIGTSPAGVFSYEYTNSEASATSFTYTVPVSALLQSSVTNFTILATEATTADTSPVVSFPPLNYGETNLEVVPCFLAGTPVLTPDGYKAIETLAQGDLVVTADFRTVPVKSTFNKEIRRAGHSSAPYFIPAGSLGPSLPVSDLVMSPGHCVQVSEAEDLWLPAWKCAKISAAVRQIRLGERITYYNLALPNYFTDNLVVFDGVVVESMNPRSLEFNKEKNAFRRLPSSN